MNTAIKKISLALLSLVVFQQTAGAQEFVTSSRNPSFDNFTNSLDGIGPTMSRLYDERT